MRPPRLHHAPPIRQHLHAANLQHRAVVPIRRGGPSPRGHDHPESRVLRFEAAPEH